MHYRIDQIKRLRITFKKYLSGMKNPPNGGCTQTQYYSQIATMTKASMKSEIRGGGVAQTFRHHAARVACKSIGGVFLSAYSGPICVQAFDNLRARVIESSAGANCMIMRMDKSLTLMACRPKLPGGTYPVGAAPGAVIVRDDQYAMWSDYADAMADMGVRRVVFRDSQLELCREWVGAILDREPQELFSGRHQLPVF